MRSAKVLVFTAVLALAVAAAVAAAAQGRTSEPGQRSRGGLLVLDGRGSRLGVTVSDLDAADAKTAPQGGVRIEEVDAGSPAEKAGLQRGDIVVDFDGERVRSARQFTRLVQETPEGRTVGLTVVRGGQRQALQVTPEARTFSWRFDVDGDRIRREVERSLRGLRDFRLDMPSFSFRFDGRALERGGRLGVSVEELTPQLAEYFGAQDGGVLVSSVMDNSAAAKAGLRAGDVITSVNGTRVRDPQALVRELAAASGEVTIGLLRDRKELTLKATLEPRAGARRVPRRRLVPAGLLATAAR
jgi:S1-C subfamily serine protease